MMIIQYTLELILLLECAKGFELRLDSEEVIYYLSFFQSKVSRNGSYQWISSRLPLAANPSLLQSISNLSSPSYMLIQSKVPNVKKPINRNGTNQTKRISRQASLYGIGQLAAIMPRKGKVRPRKTVNRSQNFFQLSCTMVQVLMHGKFLVWNTMPRQAPKTALVDPMSSCVRVPNLISSPGSYLSSQDS